MYFGSSNGLSFQTDNCAHLKPILSNHEDNPLVVGNDNFCHI